MPTNEIQELKELFDLLFEEHIHKGVDAVKVPYEFLGGNTPDTAVRNPLTADLDVGSYKIDGGTLITGHDEITSLQDADKILISDDSDSDNLKYVERDNIGMTYITASTTEVFNSPAQKSSSFDFTIPYAGTFRIEFTLRKTDTDPGADDGESQVFLYDNCNNSKSNVVETNGTSTQKTTTGSTAISHDIFTYEMQKFQLKLENNTNIINFKILYTSSNSDGVVIH